jgi:hypothetical protein
LFWAFFPAWNLKLQFEIVIPAKAGISFPCPIEEERFQLSLE